MNTNQQLHLYTNGNGHNHHQTAPIRALDTEELIYQLLQNIGQDPQQEGLQRTPNRVARMYQELTAGYHVDPEALVNGALFDVDYSEMVLVKDIEFYSLCQHHLLPFFGRAHVAYLPAGKVIGLSKIPRIVEMYARRLQLQEQMTRQIAVQLDEILQPFGVAVVVEGQHLCSMMRGVQKANPRMMTTSLLGAFQSDPHLRAEFMNHIK
jgi:GTP cyclohydrolase I